MKNRGRLISFEGIDGAGKSSHIAAVAERLRREGATVVCTREPGGTPLGERLRDELLHTPMDALTEALLVFATQQGLQPDLTLWFDLPASVAATRRAAARAPDRFEAQDAAFFERVIAGYRARAQAHPERFARIDALLAPEAVAAQIDAVLQRRGW